MGNKFNWICDDKSALEKWINGIKSNHNQESDDFIVSLRCGALCYDLSEKHVYGNDYLYADLYVGGVDTGYGYAKPNRKKLDGTSKYPARGYDYPYDYCEEASMFWKVEDLKQYDTDSLLEMIEYDLEEKIMDKDKAYEYCSLTDKARDKMKIW